MPTKKEIKLSLVTDNKIIYIKNNASIKKVTRHFL